MKSVLIIISILLFSCASYAQTDSVMVMIENQFLLVEEHDFESKKFSKIVNTIKENKETESIDSDYLKTVLDKAKIHYMFLQTPKIASNN